MASDFFFLFFFPSLFYPSPPLVGRSAWNLEHRRAIATDPRAFSLITVFRLIRKTRGTLDSPIFVNKKCPVFLGGERDSSRGETLISPRPLDSSPTFISLGTPDNFGVSFNSLEIAAFFSLLFFSRFFSGTSSRHSHKKRRGKNCLYLF